ncbi:TolC family protein [Arenibacter sp. TNZ]|jgi:outer membrane protein TolC|uniref:TolC family protein n=1 Tax=Arenibacter TaxID=178469 RepID=UPI000CD3B0A8|nr:MULTISPECIES: TolC family protein [Arenibacter]MCM4174203.1 TolC family protein [Arenibacter sp. TNZ]
MKKCILLLFLCSNLVVLGQTKKLTLTEAIEMAKKNSPEYQAVLNQSQASYWKYRTYVAQFLPQFRLSATLPDYSKSITRITNDEGQDIFVNQNQSRIDGTLSIDQRVPFTGGNLSLNSQIQRIDRFGADENSNYSLTPFSVNYYQNSLFFNPYKWDRQIEPLKYEESKRDFIERMEDISLSSCQRYFGLLTAQMRLKNSKKNLATQDTLLQIAKGRFEIGKIAENELLQMELGHLNSKNEVTTNTILLKRTSQNLARYLELKTEDIELFIPEKLVDFEVSVQTALDEATNNRKSVIEFRRRRLEAERNLAQIKGNNRLEINVNANFGLNKRAEDYDALFQDYDRQQRVSVRLGIPIFDWGVSKSERKMGEADLGLVETNIKQEQQAFEQEIYLHILNWSSKRDFLSTSEKAKEIAIKRYTITKERYILGKITITDLNLAQQEKDKAEIDYLNSLENFWTDYYTLRKLTLYDFINDKKIEAENIIAD